MKNNTERKIERLELIVNRNEWANCLALDLEALDHLYSLGMLREGKVDPMKEWSGDWHIVAAGVPIAMLAEEDTLKVGSFTERGAILEGCREGFKLVRAMAQRLEQVQGWAGERTHRMMVESELKALAHRLRTVGAKPWMIGTLMDQACRHAHYLEILINDKALVFEQENGKSHNPECN